MEPNIETEPGIINTLNMTDVKIFTSEFTAKNRFDFDDRLAGTNKDDETCRIRIDSFLVSICEKLKTYLFLGIATPSTIPAAFSSFQQGMMGFYLTQSFGASNIYPNFKDNLNNPIQLSNELAVFLSIYVEDTTIGGAVLRWEKVTLYKLTNSGSGITEAPHNNRTYGRKNSAWSEITTDVTKTDLKTLQNFIAQYLIGVIKIEHLNAENGYNASVKYEIETGLWHWYVKDTFSNSITKILLPYKQKALLNNITYTLLPDGSFIEDENKMLETIEHTLKYATGTWHAEEGIFNINVGDKPNISISGIVQVNGAKNPEYWYFSPYGQLILPIPIGKKIFIKPLNAYYKNVLGVMQPE